MKKSRTNSFAKAKAHPQKNPLLKYELQSVLLKFCSLTVNFVRLCANSERALFVAVRKVSSRLMRQAAAMRLLAQVAAA